MNSWVQYVPGHVQGTELLIPPSRLLAFMPYPPLLLPCSPRLGGGDVNISFRTESSLADNGKITLLYTVSFIIFYLYDLKRPSSAEGHSLSWEIIVKLRG